MIWLDFTRMLWGAIPAAIIFLFFSPYRKTTLREMGLCSGVLRECGMVCYVMILAGVMWLKLRPLYIMLDGFWGNIILCTMRPSWEYYVNLMPFGSFVDYHEFIQQGTAHISYVVLNRLGNFLAFAVIGFLTSLLFRKTTTRKVALIGSMISAFCEVVQYFLVRYSTLDDILLNTLGMVAGCFFYGIIRGRFPRFAEKFTVDSIKGE